MKEQEPILIMGTGALAGLFAARLAGAGRDVTVLGSCLLACRHSGNMAFGCLKRTGGNAATR